MSATVVVLLGFVSAASLAIAVLLVVLIRSVSALTVLTLRRSEAQERVLREVLFEARQSNRALRDVPALAQFYVQLFSSFRSKTVPAGPASQEGSAS